MFSVKSRWTTNSSSFVVSTIHPRAVSIRTSSMTLKVYWVLYPKKGQLYIVRRPHFSVHKLHTLLSNSEEESRIVDLLDSNIFQQEIKFPTCSRNTLDVAFCQSIAFSAEMDETFNKVYDCSDHVAIKLSVDCSIEVSKPLLQNFRSFRSVDYAGLRNTMGQRYFNHDCFTNTNNMGDEFYDYVDQLIVEHVPLRFRHRQMLCP